MMWRLLATVAAVAVLPLAQAGGAAAAPKRHNVLHMVADDLRTELSLAYAHPEVSTPHLDALTKKSMVFQNAYCQQPICSPSRNSFMSGLTPDHTRAWNFIQFFREARPSAVSFPEYFKNAGCA
jgi:arylsulfatase A-like enzyme